MPPDLIATPLGLSWAKFDRVRSTSPVFATPHGLRWAYRGER